MGRPRKKQKMVSANLTLDPDVKKAAEKLAYERNVSLSEMVRFLLEEELAEYSVSTKHEARPQPESSVAGEKRKAQ